MNGEGPYLVLYIAAAVFVAASLFGRQLPVGRVVKMALAWIAIFVAAIAIAVFLRTR
jgi:hypothetical protein